MTETQELELFISYAHEDARWKDKLVVQLTLLQQQELLTSWHDHELKGGMDWSAEIKEHLNSAQIILLLVSADFFGSDYCYKKEMPRALERHDAGEATVIPIIVRPCDWKETALARLQVLPKNSVAISKWQDEDEAFLDVVTNLRTVLKQRRPMQRDPMEPLSGLNDGSREQPSLALPRKRVSVGVDVGATKIAAGVVRLEGNSPPALDSASIVRVEHEQKKNAESVLDNLVAIIESALAKEHIAKGEIDAIGIGLPGMVRRTDGLLRFAPGLQIRNYNFCSQLQRVFGVPVHADNDVNCSTLAELTFGHGLDYDDLVCIFIGTGIGAGVVVNKRMVRGHNWSAGEIGHLKIDCRGDARQCTCGQKGCFEEYASARALIRMARMRIFDVIERQRESALGALDPRTMDPHEIVGLVMTGDAEARELADEMAWYLSIGCANVAMLLNPQAIILDGGIIDGLWGWPDFEKAINRSLAQFAVPECATVAVVRSSFKNTPKGNPAPIIGAAILPFESGFAY